MKYNIVGNFNFMWWWWGGGGGGGEGIFAQLPPCMFPGASY